MALRLLDVVPALTLMFVREVATLPTRVAEPPVVVESVRVIPFEFVKARRAIVREVALSEAVHELPTPTEAVNVLPFRPKETPFEFEKVMALRLFDVVPADTLILVKLV